MKSSVLMALWCGVVGLVHGAQPEILGRWESQGGAVRVTMSISKVADFYFVNQQWTAGGQPTVSAAVKYVAREAEGRTLLQADGELNISAVIPRKLECVVEADALVVRVTDGPFAGRHRLSRPARLSPTPVAKATPPGATAAKAAGKTAAAKKAPPAGPAKPMSVREKLLGGWTTAPDAAIKGLLVFSKNSFSVDAVKLSQEWRKGGLIAIATLTTYAITAEGNAGSIVTQEDMKYTPDITQMKFELQGDTLVITFERGIFAGTHLLKRKPE